MSYCNNIINESNRIYYFDYLRVFAICAVIIFHVSATNWYDANINDFTWRVFNFFDSITRWAVPVFVMISGALFLNKNITLKKIYSKYIKRLLYAFLLWSAIYLLFKHRHIFTVGQAIKALIIGYYHMWFIMMIIGLYICLPLTKAVTADNKRTKYYILLSFIFAFLIPTLTLLINDFAGSFLTNIMNGISTTVYNMHMDIVLGYTGYFVLGYYLYNTPINKKNRIYIYIFGILGLIFTILTTTQCAITHKHICHHYYNFFHIGILLESIAVFVWFKHKKNIKTKTYPIIQKLSKYTFGIYLVHVLVLEQLVYNLFNLSTLHFNPILSVLCISLIVYILSFIISATLHQIPVLRKYLV